MSRLDDLAERVGIEPGYYDIAGNWTTTPTATKEALLLAMGVDPTADLPEDISALGAAKASSEEAALSCVRPSDRGIVRAFGLACQVYGLRSARNLGIGDLEDVAGLSEEAARQGADLLGVSPLHARFLAEPDRCSPYAPSSRRWLDPLLIAVDAAAAELGVPTLSGSPSVTGLAPADGLVNYATTTAAKVAAFQTLFEAFKAEHLAPGAETELGRSFLGWRAEQGEPLEAFGRFEVISAHQAMTHGRPVPWWDWPAELRLAGGPGVDAFAQAYANAVDRACFLQWLADRQLAQAQARARAAGMRLGLYTDLAVGVVADGADVWADPEAVIRGASIGAPPDAFSPVGQNWHVAPLSPLALRRRDFEPLRAVLRAAMRHAGAVRIDHVMGLMRLFWIPAGGGPADGTYVRYPLADMLRAVALESRRLGTVVVGEDLGNVPDGFRPAAARAGLLSYRVVWFERWESGLFKASAEYPAAALATVSTHDLPTVEGYPLGRDIDWRERVGQLDHAAAEAEHEHRRIEAARLGDALAFEQPEGGPGPDAGLAVPLHHFLARTPAVIAMAQLEDLGGAVEQPNLPGTVDAHPNWRRRAPLAAGEIGSDPRAQAILAALRAERPR